MKAVTSPIQAVKRDSTFSKGFTLLELMIVIIIMGIVYSMVNVSMKNSAKTLSTLSPKTIASVLQSIDDGVDRSFYIYGDECDQAMFIPELDEKIEIGDVFFATDTEVYELDAFGSTQVREFSPLEIEDETFNVCMKFNKYANGSVSHFIYKNGNRFYQNNPYFGKVHISETLDEAKEKMENRSINPDYTGIR